jgi:hypothetical protein
VCGAELDRSTRVRGVNGLQEGGAAGNSLNPPAWQVSRVSSGALSRHESMACRGQVTMRQLSQLTGTLIGMIQAR